MTTITIPKKITKGEDLVVIRRKEYETLLKTRKEADLIFPQEDLKDYVHSARLRKSLQKAIRRYPPEATPDRHS